MITLALAFAISQKTQPAWMDWTIAGYSLAYDEKHGPVSIHDPKSSYYLYRTVDCDGAILGLILTATPLDDSGYTIVNKRLPSLSTGKGIHLGDSPSRIRQLLGKPSRERNSEELPGSKEYVYSWSTGKRDDDYKHDECYTFKRSRLVRINFGRIMNSV